MDLTTLKPPCYNDGDKQTLIDVKPTTDLATLRMLVSLSGKFLTPTLERQLPEGRVS